MMKTLVTGGNSGIGAALVHRLAQEGHEVTFTFCHNEDKARSVASDSGARCVRYDQSAPDSVAALARHLREAEFDSLVNNASQPAQRRLLSKIDAETFIAYQAVAVRGVFELSQAFAEQARRRGAGGAIVNVLTSYTLGMPPAKLATYVTSKHALLGLTRSMAVEFIRYGIRVNAVSPGMTRTDFLADLPEQFIDQVEAALPMERLATAAEVAAVIRFLLSREASYINGVNIPVSGGQAC
jgi:NAD(P)-dependent dehydrogenase (short-subunit alcohol dehydrogenase family)